MRIPYLYTFNVTVQIIPLLSMIQCGVIMLLIFKIRYFPNCSYRGLDVENAIKLAAADDGFVTYDELRENLRK